MPSSESTFVSSDRELATAGPIRLTVVLTHPVQYFAPWFRHIARSSSCLDLTVLYASSPTPVQQGAGFGQPFVWDVPVTGGYRSRIVRTARSGDRFDSSHYRGLDVPEIGDAVRDSRPDVVMTPGWNSITLVRALRACRQLGVPVLYRGDSHLQSGSGGWRRTLRRVRARRLLHQFNGFLSVGHRSEAFLRYFDMPPGRIFPTPHAVDNAWFADSAAGWQTTEQRESGRHEFGFDARTFVVIFAGKFETKKHPLDVIRAVARLGPDAGLLMVGAGPLEDACRQEAAALGVRVAWTGFLNQSAIARAYALADCLALPSDWDETWGLVVNEAMATGLPCVVSNRVGCAPDLIEPGVTGETFVFGDVEDLAGQLARIRTLKAEGHDLSTTCRTRVSQSGFEQATAGLERACRAVTAGFREVPHAAPRVLACCGSMVSVFGLERMTFEALATLRERGAAVHCIVNSWENHRITALADRIGASWSVGAYRAPLRRRTRRPVDWIRAVTDVIRTSGGLLRDVRGFRPTTILVPDMEAAIRNWPALLVLRSLGFPVVMRLGNAPASLPFHRRLWRWLIGPSVSRFGCNSRFTESRLLATGVPARKVRVIYNTVPSRAVAAPLAPAVQPDRIIYVGQIIPEKGLDLLLDAVGLLAGKGLNARLDVVGRMDGWIAPSYGDYREQLRARADQSDLAGRVRFLGWRDDVPALLAVSAVHCCPSRRDEGFGLVVAEAKQAGVPSVVTPVGALPELVAHGEDGWVCSDISAAALAEGLSVFLADPQRRLRAAAAARASAAAFTREPFADAWYAVITGEAGRCA